MENSVIVLTKAKPFEKEEFVDVFSSIGSLEKHLRTNVSPNIRKDEEGQYHTGKERNDIILYFARKTTVK